MFVVIAGMGAGFLLVVDFPLVPYRMFPGILPSLKFGRGQRSTKHFRSSRPATDYLSSRHRVKMDGYEILSDVLHEPQPNILKVVLPTTSYIFGIFVPLLAQHDRNDLPGEDFVF